MTAYDKQLDSLRVLNSDRSLTKQMIEGFRVLKKNRANCGNPSVRFLKEIHHLGVSLSQRVSKKVEIGVEVYRRDKGVGRNVGV